MSVFVFKSPPSTPAPSVFPLAISSDARYTQQADGTPFPILSFASWYIVSRTQSERRAFIDDNVAKGFNCIEFDPLPHNVVHTQPHTAPLNANNDAPFTKTLSGSAWSGSTTYSNINNEAPDFTQPNEAYWTVVDDVIDYCASKGVPCMMFPAYVGFPTTAEGWREEMLANGATKLQIYGAWIANRYKNRSNIVWMLMGDDDFSTAPQIAVENALIAGINSVSGQLSTNFSGEPSGGQVRDVANYGQYITLNGIYEYFNQLFRERAGYAHAAPTMPTFFLEGPYEENGQVTLADPPMRRYAPAQMLSGIAGYTASNTNIWQFNDVYATKLNSAMRTDLAFFNTFIKSLAWYRLVPDGLGSIGTLVTAGQGSMDDQTAQNYVAAAATPLGDLLLAHIGPLHTGTITIDMTKLRGTVTARWWNPTTGTYTAIGSFANTGTRAFTPPANHADGFGDWILRLDA